MARLDTEDWKEIKDAWKKHRQSQCVELTSKIIKWCTENNVGYDRLTEYQIRITGSTTIDIYPSSKKYHNITTSKRGLITTSITKFLQTTLK